MKSAENFIRKRKENYFYSNKLPHIRWNFEPAPVGENHFEDLKGIYNFFIINRNPELILNKTLEQFSSEAFHPNLELIEKIYGRAERTVNDYLFASFYTDKKLERLKFEFTKIPVFRDSNLTSKYLKSGDILKYLSRFIDE